MSSPQLRKAEVLRGFRNLLGRDRPDDHSTNSVEEQQLAINPSAEVERFDLCLTRAPMMFRELGETGFVC